MQRVLIILIAGLAMVMFAWSNVHHVEVGCVFGRPVQVRLIFLLLTTFLLGHFTAVLLSVYMRSRIKSKARREKMAHEAHEDDDDEFLLD